MFDSSRLDVSRGSCSSLSIFQAWCCQPFVFPLINTQTQIFIQSKNDSQNSPLLFTILIHLKCSSHCRDMLLEYQCTLWTWTQWKLLSEVFACRLLLSISFLLCKQYSYSTTVFCNPWIYGAHLSGRHSSNMPLSCKQLLYEYSCCVVWIWSEFVLWNNVKILLLYVWDSIIIFVSAAHAVETQIWNNVQYSDSVFRL